MPEPVLGIGQVIGQTAVCLNQPGSQHATVSDPAIRVHGRFLLAARLGREHYFSLSVCRAAGIEKMATWSLRFLCCNGLVVCWTFRWRNSTGAFTGASYECSTEQSGNFLDRYHDDVKLND
jgi:hypothetical protein